MPQELYSLLNRMLQIEDKLKTAKLLGLRSFILGFSTVDNFIEKGEIYLALTRVLRRTKNTELIQRIEIPMLIAIRTKISWNTAEEMLMMANIYLTMYQIKYVLQCTLRILLYIA